MHAANGCLLVPLPLDARCVVLRQVDVLVEGYNEDGTLCGRTQWDAPGDPLMPVSQGAKLHEQCLGDDRQALHRHALVMQLC